MILALCVLLTAWNCPPFPSCRSWLDDDDNDLKVGTYERSDTQASTLDAEFERFESAKSKDAHRERLIKEQEAQQAREQEEQKAKAEADKKAEQERRERYASDVP